MKNILISIKQFLNKAIKNQRGEAETVILTIVGTVLLVGGMYGVTVYSTAGKADKIAQEVYDSATSECVSKIVSKRVVDPTDIDELQQRVDATGVLGDITIEIQHKGNNPGKKAVLTSEDLVGENQSYSTYYNGGDISEPIKLNKGDKAILTVKNKSQSYSKKLMPSLFGTIGQKTTEILATSQGLVI